jgi:DNA-binding transcriptional LysR family regulator
MADRFNDLQTFVTLVEAGSISRSAERLDVAKSVVSRRLSELEARLGVQLFQRTTRKLHLTDSGQSFYERAVRILCDLDEAEQAVAQSHTELSGVLRVALPVSFGLLHMGPAINEFMHAHPRVRFDLDFNDRQVDLVQEGIDVAIRIARLEDSSLIARPLAPIKSVICASPAYLQAHGTPRTPQELPQHACLIYSNTPDPQQWVFQDADGNVIRVKVPATLKANNGDFLRAASVAGEGIVWQPVFLAYRNIESGELVPLLTDYHWQDSQAYAVYPQTRHLSQRVRAFVDFLVQRFAGVPYWDKCLGG